ncbi:Histidinol dehydrogenase [Sulfolobus islandicus Y.G.57.14]|uniref:Histidinol dehydrogenase n=6 Tax=Saccharolobus islandicus TaxID=43080 RepID=M9UF81_SACIS|nr:histidinol dehydrogenase [Sulfolobus islandicus]ACP35647.1 Histidinol dehydrogenase [Sulfolobus islandicus L.S.2.15]ACP45801.1 Histidinol dehydrogenase [Sulfolobus islandicus Y.G.57.14]ADB87404.1 Histidinol dehydrogenase [Sulfolobus islandicus L.D.8.5]ADX82849.1 Histidinol dehydrogenase [Sulfolobus islandicus HVE10/4]ADX85476.1 Histidinol dehydrogenase [Sulfolobus islandicus REY15A]
MISYSLPNERPNDFSRVIPVVRDIIESVKARGDNALYQLTEKLDKVKINNIKVSEEELKTQASKLDPKVKQAIDVAYEQLKAFHEMLVPPNIGGGYQGISFGVVWRSIEKIGIYVPSGKYSYPSTLLMAGIPAKVAKVKEIYVASPPNQEGSVNPALAYVAIKLGVNDVYKVGGAQAIAALAYGTESVRKVYKIVGPGNVYVQAAKFLVSNVVGIDGIEGPTELVIIADETAKPEHVVLDMKAQAEHGPDTYIVLLSNDDELLKKVEEKIMDDKKIYYIIKTKNIDEAIEIANKIAPEHLSLYVKDAYTLMDKIVNAGAISLGNTPPAIIDYVAGPNHILPTNGWARIRGGVTVYDFIKPTMYANVRDINKQLLEASISLANYEGFVIHGKSIGVRYE